MSFLFGESGKEHTYEGECRACWGGFPQHCPDHQATDCRQHAEFGDKNSDGDYWLFHECEIDAANIAKRANAQSASREDERG